MTLSFAASVLHNLSSTKQEMGLAAAGPHASEALPSAPPLPVGEAWAAEHYDWSQQPAMTTAPPPPAPSVPWLTSAQVQEQPQQQQQWATELPPEVVCVLHAAVRMRAATCYACMRHQHAALRRHRGRATRHRVALIARTASATTASALTWPLRAYVRALAALARASWAVGRLVGHQVRVVQHGRGVLPACAGGQGEVKSSKLCNRTALAG